MRSRSKDTGSIWKKDNAGIPQRVTAFPDVRIGCAVGMVMSRPTGLMGAKMCLQHPIFDHYAFTR